MKKFIKTVLAVLCALILLRIIGFLVFLGMAGSLLSGGKTALPRSGVLDLNLSEFELAEQTQESPLPEMNGLLSTGGTMLPAIGLHDAVKALQLAAEDPGVQCVLLRADGLTGGMASTEELRTALTDFRQSGKAVVAYTENPGNASYYLATAADKVWMGKQHGGNYQLVGISTQMMFLKDILDKLGVHIQLIRHGKYKSAGEMFIKSSSSPENREQYQRFIDSAWKAYSSTMAASRGLTEEQFNALIDNLALNFPEDFLENGLVDELVDHQTLQNKMCTLARVQDADHLKLIPFVDYVLAKVPQTLPGRNNVAVLYAEGDITDGFAYTGVAADRFVKVIDDLRKDKSVKAVVLRVNSPGGSVSASVKIRTALELLQQEKPLVASYGNYAASGGYWISSGCQKIYSDASTLTGSIGVFSMLPEFSGVSRKLGVGIETVGSNKHSDLYSLMRPLDDAELAYMQASVEDIYESFVNLVADSRDKGSEEVDAIAQGRIWAGTDALEIGLVDEIGNLEAAIAYAASLADFHASDEYTVVGYPRPLTVMESLMLQIGQFKEEPSILAGTPFATLGKDWEALQAKQPGEVFARLPVALEIR